MKLLTQTVMLIVVCAFLNGCDQPKETNESSVTEVQKVETETNWDAVSKMSPEKLTFSISASGNSESKVGEDVTYRVNSDRDGYLSVISVDSEDVLGQIFPNIYVENTKVVKNQWKSIPEENSWSLSTEKPLGDTVVVFIVSKNDVDISKAIENGNIKGANDLLNASGDWAIAAKVVLVKE